MDMKQFPGITSAEMEYRAKLVELHQSGDLGAAARVLVAADKSKVNDGHSVASARIKCEFADIEQPNRS